MPKPRWWARDAWVYSRGVRVFNMNSERNQVNQNQTDSVGFALVSEGSRRGGFRVGSGRKPAPRVERVCENPDCGAVFRRLVASRQRFCRVRCARSMPRGGVAHSTRVCRVCPATFRPKYAAQIVCSSTCAIGWIRRTQASPVQKLEHLRQRRRRHSALRRATDWRVEVGRWRRICERDGWTCWICETPIDRALAPPDRMSGTVDHVVPLSEGGSDDDSNVRAAHLSCNSKRRAIGATG